MIDTSLQSLLAQSVLGDLDILMYPLVPPIGQCDTVSYDTTTWSH